MMKSGYPGNNEYPIPYRHVNVIVMARGKIKAKYDGVAYWSGFRWMGVDGFRIGYGRVIKWIDK